jgi:hypothetical protein
MMLLHDSARTTLLYYSLLPNEVIPGSYSVKHAYLKLEDQFQGLFLAQKSL